ERDQPAPPKPEAPTEAKSPVAALQVFDTSGAPKPAVSAEAKSNPPEAPPPPRKPSSKLTVLAGGVAQATINNLLAASGDAGLSLEEITFSQIGLINASWMAMPELLPSEAVALLDIGYSHSTISVLVNGEPAVTRVVDLGGHKLTSHLAEAMNLNYPTAEALKMSLPEKVQDRLKNVIAPLGKESRAAMSFFENEHDKVVGQVFVSGGSARSKFLLQMLEEELMVPCQKWNPAKGLALPLPPDQAANLEQDAPQLAAAIGLAHSWFKPAKVRVNLLAEKQEEEMLRRRDPVKWGLRAAAFLVFLMLLWAGMVWFQVHNTDLELNRHQSHLDSLQKISREVTTYNRKAGEVERTIAKLDQLSTNRFLWTLPLNTFQFAIVDGIQVVRLTMEELIIHTPATEPTTVGSRTVPGKPATCAQRITLTITAKDYANPPAAEKFVETISALPYFKKNLREVAPILLKDRLPLQVDPLDPSRKFILFKLECFFADKVSLDE
ncbi:MAG: pilus assembly protein PilM, partial [Chloroflexi bacterium]|nr:pilus assembly protein PilM [Chloroflexota bacterium]